MGIGDGERSWIAHRASKGDLREDDFPMLSVRDICRVYGVPPWLVDPRHGVPPWLVDPRIRKTRRERLRWWFERRWWCP